MPTEAMPTGSSETSRCSPRILEVSWGSVRVEGRGEPYRDAKLWPGGSRAWDWNETGTHHVPGVQPTDVAELLANGAHEIVLARGMNRRLRVQDETLRWLERRGVKVHALETREAAELYNELRKDRAVGALIHSTC